MSSNWRDRGAIDQFQGEYRWLSNFASAVVTLDGKSYPSTEHAFQAAKTYDANERTKVRNAPSAGKAKSLGRKVTLRRDWESVKIEIMYDLNKQKFSKHDFRNILLNTGMRELVEGNSWGDEFWGVDIQTGEGHNHLGKILMRIREELRNE
jgi:ribA/ribD-fused uncharacterized protein